MDKRVSLYLGNIEKSYRHVHEAIECYLVIRGELEIEVEDESVRLSGDDLLIINMNQIHLVKGNKRNLILCLRIEKEYLEEECRELLYQTIQCDSTKETEADRTIYFECKRLLTRMLLIHTEKQKGYHLEFQAVFYFFLSHLLTYFVPEESAKTAEQGVSEPLEEVLQYIKVNYNQDISQVEMAKMAHLSTPYFSRYFKQRVGIGFLDYLTKIRLDHTLPSLLQTDHSILRIALEHGFANQKSFSEKFKREYGENPSEYRKRYQNQSDQEQSENIRHKFDIHMEEGLIPFLKYIHQHDTEDKRKVANTWQYRLDLGKAEGRIVDKTPLIINIEHIRNMQNPEVLEQLAVADQALHFTYIYFKAFSDEEERLYMRGDSFDFYELYQIVSRIESFGFVPFIQIDFSDICKRTEWAEDYHCFAQFLKGVFRFLVNRFPSTYIRRWKVELCCTEDREDVSFHEFYRVVYVVLSRYLEASGIGVLGLRNLSRKNKVTFTELLSYARDHRIIPGFFSFHAFPEDDLFRAFRDGYQEVSRYYNRMIEEIILISERYQCGGGDIYMTKWNTLAGRNLAESGTFFRASLIVDGFCRVAPYVKGVGLHLGTYEVSRDEERTNTSVLALFLFYKVKRPLFFIAEALVRIGRQILLQDERIQITRNLDGEYAILFSPPSYVDPGNSIDPAFLQKHNTEIQVELKALPPGRYQIKTFHMDQEGSGVYNRWEGAGFPDFLDPDVVQYLELAVIPELKVEEVDVEDTCQIRESISFNGVILKLMKLI